MTFPNHCSECQTSPNGDYNRHPVDFAVRLNIMTEELRYSAVRYAVFTTSNEANIGLGKVVALTLNEWTYYLTKILCGPTSFMRQLQ